MWLSSKTADKKTTCFKDWFLTYDLFLWIKYKAFKNKTLQSLNGAT